MPTPTIGDRTRKNNHNVYILGAGFGVDAGLPTVANFLNQMRDTADWVAKEHRDDERNAVEKVLEFRHRAAGAGYRINVDLDNIEDLFSLASLLPDTALTRDMQLAIGATLEYARFHSAPLEGRIRLRESPIWPITEAWKNAASRITAPGDGRDIHSSCYDYYAAVLAGRTSNTEQGRQNVVLTFNYDLLLETSLGRLGIPFSYDLGTNGIEYEESAECLPESRSGALSILKLHGSQNWLIKGDGHLRVCGSYDSAIKGGGVPHVVPPTWEKSVTGLVRGLWDQAVAALRQATRIIVIGLSFRAIDAHFKYLLAAGLMENSSLRRIFVVNPAAKRLAPRIRSVIRADQFRYETIELHDMKVHQFFANFEALDRIGRATTHDSVLVTEIDGLRWEKGLDYTRKVQ